MHEDAKCRECEKWSPGRGLVGKCAAASRLDVPSVGHGWSEPPTWSGLRRCADFRLAVGLVAVEQTDAVAALLLAEPLAHRRVMLARMSREDAALTECIKLRMVALHREARA
jgi:hypothetical protein